MKSFITVALSILLSGITAFGVVKASDHFLLKTGPYMGQRVCVDGPEYESAAGLGPSCGIYNPQEVLEINFYCDTYGLDTISYGTMTAFLMECYERGILNEELGIKLSNIYVKYEETNHWGWNGSNF